MSHEYSDSSRAEFPTSLPNIEVFYATEGDLWELAEGDLSKSPEGYYWQACFPGCLPDGEPNGPFASYAEALADAQEDELS